MATCAMFNCLFEKIEFVRKEKPSAGTKYRLMGLAADIGEVTETLRREVLQRVSQEAVLDADTDADFDAMADEMLSWELMMTGEDLQELTQQVNDALGGLSVVLMQISSQLSRHHKDEEYARLYEQEKRRYMNSGTSKRSRQTFEEWKELNSNDQMTLEDLNDYRTGKLLKMFGKGVFDKRVEQIQRAKRYPDEMDFDSLDDDHKLKKSVYKHYAALRKIVDFKDGSMVVDAVKAGRHFYVCRHEENAKTHRNAFLKYMHKISMAQEEYQKLQEAQRQATNEPREEKEQLNFFAPKKNLKVLLAEEWFGVLTTDEKCYNQQWKERFVDALMGSQWGEQIARDWAVGDKRLTLKCMIIGCLKDAGALKGSYNQIAKLLDMDDENPATLAKYLGMGKKQPFAEWIADYVKG